MRNFFLKKFENDINNLIIIKNKFSVELIMSTETDFTLDWEKSCWSVIEKMFKRCGGNHLVEHQISSYNNFIEKDLTKMLTNHEPILLSYEWDEELRRFTYEIEITFDI